MAALGYRREEPLEAPCDTGGVVSTVGYEPPRWCGKVVAVVLALWPTVVYWNTIFARYGFRDDYPNVREAIDEPGNLLRVQTERARPFYGWLLESGLEHCRGVDDLIWIRLTTALLLGALAVAVFGIARRRGWSTAGAAAVGALLPRIGEMFCTPPRRSECDACCELEVSRWSEPRFQTCTARQSRS
jgi:hypothetical protein